MVVAGLIRKLAFDLVVPWRRLVIDLKRHVNPYGSFVNGKGRVEKANFFGSPFGYVMSCTVTALLGSSLTSVGIR